ncbi:MAG: T9SS type A sorting domain-containing protein [Fibrobacterota bacterium]
MNEQRKTAVLILLMLTMVLFAEESRGTDRGFSYKGLWVKDSVYKGDYANKQGDTVQWGEFNGRPLYWWSKFWTQGSEPGTFGRQGGTNPWVLINSSSYNPEQGQNSVDPTWVGWNSDLERSLTAGEAACPTWRDGAEGAYTIIHDDIGALDYNNHVLPALEVNRKYPDIKVSWGVFVEETAEDEWKQMQQMVAEGHEMTSHSMHHTSAAEQWQWFNDGDTLSVDDPSIPAELKGLVVKGFPMPEYAAQQGKSGVTIENELAVVTYDQAWGGCVADPDAYNSNATIEVSPKSGVETITLSTGQKQYVKYTDGGDVDSGEGRQGYILSASAGWYEMEDAPSSWEPNGGITWFLTKVFCVDKWSPDEYRVEIVESRDSIDENVYAPLQQEFGQFFPPTMRTQYFCYPFDAYSEVTHDSIESRNYVSARGGAKSGTPIPCDFFHPYRLDFDAFYMMDPQASIIYPENPHVILSLQGLVDSTISQKGYMIRELHAVCKVPFEDINSPAVGGWWGGITQDLYDEHLAYCTQKIESNELTTYNASEVIRYRMTANAVNGVSLQKNGNEYTLQTDVEDIAEKYHDEISIIVRLEDGCDKLDVVYKNTDPVWGNHPYQLPRKLTNDGTAWSINVNPYLGDATILPGTDWTGDKVAITEINKKSVQPDYSVRLRGNRLNLMISDGIYNLTLTDIRGRQVAASRLQVTNGQAAMDMKTNLSRGIYFLSLTSKDRTYAGRKLIIR